MFANLTMRGRGGAILWGHRPAATLREWTVTKDSATTGRAVWSLTATINRAYPLELRQRGLLLSAPRRGGFWVWPVLEPPTITASTLTARLGPPEQ